MIALSSEMSLFKTSLLFILFFKSYTPRIICTYMKGPLKVFGLYQEQVPQTYERCVCLLITHT